MTTFYVFLTVLLTLLVMAAGLYWIVPWLMERDCKFEVSSEDYDSDLVDTYEHNPDTDMFEKVNGLQ